MKGLIAYAPYLDDDARLDEEYWLGPIELPAIALHQIVNAIEGYSEFDRVNRPAHRLQIFIKINYVSLAAVYHLIRL